MSSVGDVPQWELCKENAAPLERGRNVEKLSKALAPKTSAAKAQRQEDDKNIRTFERLIRNSEKFAELYAKSETPNEDDVISMLEKCKVDKDPIVHWLKYIKYHEEAYPSDTHYQFLLKERCVMTLLHHPKYANDVRYIRVCVLYADGADDPHGQFKFFHKHKLGSEVAIFWLAWAWVAEKKKDFQFADKIFRKAIQKKAKPDKVVDQRYKQFQRRMSRHWLNANANNPENVYDGEEDEQGVRGALSGLTVEGARQNHRGRSVNAMAQRRAVGTNGQSIIDQRQHAIERTNIHDSSKIFHIFSDDREQEEGGLALQSPGRGDENVPLPQMTRQSDRTKENKLEAEAWNQRGGLNNQHHIADDAQEDRGMLGASSVVSRWAGSGVDSITAGGTSSQPAFQVFVDDDCVDSKENTKVVKQAKLSERALRQRLDETRDPFKSARSTSAESSTETSVRPKPCFKPPLAKPSQSRHNVKKTAMPLGFDNKLISRDRKERESCFEEQRARAGRYKLIPSTATNFNLLHKVEGNGSMSTNSSCMDIDEGSTIEEVEMEDDSRSIDIIREDEETKNESIDKNQSTLFNSKKVLFGANTSMGNHSSRAHNTSTASSTVDERDAVGVVGDREETLNTKFAARELSMMFSSPGGFMSQSVLKSSKKTSEKLLFSIHQDNEEEGSDSSGDEQVGRDTGGAFDIFCDDKEVNMSGGKGDPKPVPKSGFAIYEESESDDNSFDEEGRNGDTASLADIMDIMKDTSLEKHSVRGRTLGAKGKDDGGFSIFCDDTKNDGTILTEDTATFGDLSFIPSAADGDTCNLQDRMKMMNLS